VAGPNDAAKPMPPLQAASIAKEYLKNQGVAFRA